MKSKWFSLISLLSLAALLIAACGGTTAPTATPVAAQATATTASTEMPTAAPTEMPTAASTEMATAAPTEMPTAAPTPSGYAGSTCPLTPESGASITFSGWGDPSEQQVYRDSITRFQEVCPGITVDYVPIPSDFQTKLEAQMAGGTAPDVFYVDNILMTAFGPTGQLLPLNDLMAQANVSADQFIPALLGEFTLNNQIYGLPKDWGTLGLIYLPEAFTAAGISEPTADWTFDDLRTAAQAISAAGQYKGFCQDADWARFAPWVFGNGGSYTTPDFKTATLDTSEVTQMAQMTFDMISEGSMVQHTDVGASWCGDAIGKQLVGMTLEGGWIVPFMTSTYPDVNYKSQLLPQGPVTRADIIFTNAIGINASTQYPNAAADFLFYVTSEINQLAIEKTGFAYSTHPGQIVDVVDQLNKNIAAGGLLPDTKNAYWGPYTGQLETAITNALSRVYLKQQNVADSFAQAQQEGQAALNGQ
jgi:multiple sugar transport system substrate-binding protein